MKIWHWFAMVFGALCGTLALLGGITGDSNLILAAGTAWVGLTVMSYFMLHPIEMVAARLESIANGEFHQDQLLTAATFASSATMIRATNTLSEQLADVVSRAEELASGHIDVVKVEGAVLRSEKLSAADEKIPKNAGPLEASFIHMTNQMRRLSIQARIIARDDLSNPLLDEQVPGEVGDAFEQMVKNLRQLNHRAELIAKGDLVSQLDLGEGGELSESFNQMTDRLIGLVNQITKTALHISASTGQMSAVLREQDLAATHQASSVEETQRTMETLLSSAKKIAESAQTVFKSAERTQANNRTVAERIGELKSHTERIGEILDVIKSIADRSDLLALNASLEGMRAGEAGKGFTLVAAEMRRLAENIKDSVGDINELLVDIRESSLSSVMATEEGSNLSERTTESALKITLITQQQQSGTEQVTQSMEELSLLINQGVSGTKQLSSASSELVDLAEGLRALVERFKTGEAAVSREFKIVDVAPQVEETKPTKSAKPKKQKTSDRTRRPTRDATPTPMGVHEHEATPTPAGVKSKDEDPPTVELSSLSDDEELDLVAGIAQSASDESGERSFESTMDDLDAAIDKHEDS